MLLLVAVVVVVTQMLQVQEVPVDILQAQPQ